MKNAFPDHGIFSSRTETFALEPRFCSGISIMSLYLRLAPPPGRLQTRSSSPQLEYCCLTLEFNNDTMLLKRHRLTRVFSKRGGFIYFIIEQSGAPVSFQRQMRLAWDFDR
jgi:hypothetical protein